MTLTISTNAADSAAAEAIAEHQAQLAGTLSALTSVVVEAAARGDQSLTLSARDDLRAWCRSALLPHASAQKSVLYAAARAQTAGRLLIDAMIVEQDSIAGLADALDTDDPVRLAATAHALQTLLALHIDKVNNYVIPLLAAAPDVSLTQLLQAMDTLRADHDGLPDTDQSATHADDHACGCDEPADPSYPELDARLVPHAIRHATVFGALDAVRSGRGLILVAPHDPLPLLAQLEKRAPETFSVSYLERGPDAWRLSLVRN